MRPTRRAFLGTVAATTALAGCVGGGGGGDGGDTDTPTETPMATPTSTEEPMESPSGTGTTTPMAATVMVASHPDHGDILVDGEGLTLYMFDNDTQGESASSCYDGCAQAWPPLLSEDPTAGDGVTAELTTLERDTGEMQVAANGWPLYYYASDESPGDATGQGVGDVWWVLGPDGTPKRPEMTETTTQSMY